MGELGFANTTFGDADFAWVGIVTGSYRGGPGPGGSGRRSSSRHFVFGMVFPSSAPDYLTQQGQASGPRAWRADSGTGQVGDPALTSSSAPRDDLSDGGDDVGGQLLGESWSSPPIMTPRSRGSEQISELVDPERRPLRSPLCGAIDTFIVGSRRMSSGHARPCGFVDREFSSGKYDPVGRVYEVGTSRRPIPSGEHLRFVAPTQMAMSWAGRDLAAPLIT